MSRRILIVDDDDALSEVIRDKLVIEGFDVECAVDADEALRQADALMPDLVLLDVMLPKASGFDLVPMIRHSRKVPIIFLSARGLQVDKLRGLEAGADDYITKPFDMQELLARIRAVLRRTSSVVDVIKLGAVTVDFTRRVATGPAGTILLTNREFEILQFLAERANRTVHRDQLINQVWGSISPGTIRSVDRAIARLREKIEPDTKRPRYLITAYGEGYALQLS
jgi:two-component system, OmpR family, response regulator VicR